jgi:hypothetical protein
LLLRAVVVCCATAVGGVLWGAGPATAGVSHPGGVDDTCDEVLRGSPGEALTKETDPPAGSEVRAGDEVTVRLQWDPGDFADGPLHKVLDCVTVAGDLDRDRSVQKRDPANDGEFIHRYRIPGDAAPGTRVCDRGFVSGDGSGGDFERQKSNDVCFEVTVPASDAGQSAPPDLPPAIDTGGEERTAAVAPAPSAPPAEALSSTQTAPTPQAVGTLPVTGWPGQPLLLAGLAFVAAGVLLAPSRLARRRP